MTKRLTGVAVAALAIVALATFGAPARAQRALTASGSAPDLPNAIVGRVLDPAGNPAPGVLVTLLHRAPADPNRDSPLVAMGNIGTYTNARGEYRLEHLRPSSYYAVALPQNLPASAGPVQIARSGFTITYHPNVLDVSAARPVVLGSSGTVTADITLSAAPLFTLSGRVVASEGQPWLGRRLGVSHGAHLFGVDSKAVSIRPDGTFNVPNLTSGRYCLSLPLDRAPRDVIPYVFGAKVTVATTDVTNVEVRRIDMVRATGRVVFPADPSFPPRDSFTVAGLPDECNPGPTRPGNIRPDMTFNFFAWPGQVYVGASTQQLPPRTLRMTVTHNGVDVTRRGIEFAQGREVSGIVIEMQPPAPGQAAPR